MKSRPSCDVRTMLRSRVVPAIELTMARPRPARRLNRVDLPTLARPTRTTVGNPSADAASMVARWGADLAVRAISEAQLLELARVAGPAAFDLDAQFEKDAAIQHLFEFETGAGADLLEFETSGANYHALLRIALDDHDRGDADEVAFRLFGELLDRDRGREGNLLAHREENLLAYDLFGDHPFGLVGVLFLGHQGRAFRQHRLDHTDQFVDVFAGERADRYDFRTRQRLMRSFGQSYELIAPEQIDLVNGEHGGPSQPREIGEKAAVFTIHPPARGDYADHHFTFVETAPCRFDHAAVERAVRFMQAGRVDQDHLGIGIAANSDDAPASGLRLGRYDGDLLADDAIEQGRFADVGASAESHEAGAMPARAIHLRPDRCG